MKDIRNFINGEFVTNISGRTFEKRTPIDDSVIGVVHEAGRPEVDAAVVAARTALRGPWGTMSVTDRVKLLDAVADEISRRFDDFLAAEVADTGKSVSLRMSTFHAAPRTSRCSPTPSRTPPPSRFRWRPPTGVPR